MTSLDPALLQIAAVGSVTVALYDGRVAAVGVFVRTARESELSHDVAFRRATRARGGNSPGEIVDVAPWFAEMAVSK